MLRPLLFENYLFIPLFLIPFFRNNFKIILNEDIIKNGMYIGSIKDYISESKKRI
jgi:hypothetical protein